MRTSFLSVAAVLIGQQVLAAPQTATQIFDGQPEAPTATGASVTTITRGTQIAISTASEYITSDHLTRISDHQSQVPVMTSALPIASSAMSGLVTQSSEYPAEVSSTMTTSAVSASIASSSTAAASSPAVAFTSTGSIISVKTAFGAMVGLSIVAAMML